ncbi:lipase esterase family protein [Grosmannia clavigera kw1407]|uniref:Lipase esterase family protein n=1 Tax=Grosmannia clavigera (strain kw1407 / UAMH 11150) TaxID=655863 RepID=F0X791_GROCL|nr:lipase esterase family protein [Grosmannia clavigera kw1407]EFX06321.1 lipase esterase family protein [Grosmannia clavigera kw1407]
MATEETTSSTANGRRYEHLSSPDPVWLQVAEKHQVLEPLADKLYSLPIEEFRKVPYKPPPLPANAPVIGKDVAVEQAEITVRDGAKIAARICRPIERKDGSVLFFNIHGGGWTVGTPETEEAVSRQVAVQNKAVVVSIDYRRAPEYPFPYALNDSKDALLWCKDHAKSLGIDPERLIIGGGSAGANIASPILPLYPVTKPRTNIATVTQAAALSHIARDEGIGGIIGQVLNIPVTCHPDHFPTSKYEYHSFEQNAGSPIVNAFRMRKFWGFYLPTADANPLASPLLSKSFTGLPPALVQVAGMDPLRDEGLAYAEELKANGVDVVLNVYKGLPHAFYIYPDLPPSARYTQSVVDWIEQLLAKTGGQ